MDTCIDSNISAVTDEPNDVVVGLYESNAVSLKQDFRIW